MAELVFQYGSVFQRLICSLRKILKHGMSGVAEQGDAIARPVVDGTAIEHGPAPVELDRGGGSTKARVNLREVFLEFLGRAPIFGAFFVVSAPEHRDLIENGSVVDDVLSEVNVRANPNGHVVEVGTGSGLLDRDGAAIAHAAGANWIAVVAHNRSDAGAETVSSNQCIAFVDRSVRAYDPHAIAEIFDPQRLFFTRG